VKYNILIVDDEQAVLDTTAEVLRAAGFTVRVARDGNVAVEEVRRHAPDLVLSDVAMPELNGYQMCRQIKGDPTTSEVPVLLMSRKADAADKYWAKQVGARALLRKPMEQRRLVEEVEATFAERDASR